MKFHIRQGLFETNSSSVHTLTICTEKEYEDFKNGKLFYDNWHGKITDEKFNYDADRENMTYEGYEEYLDKSDDDFGERFTTPSGDRMVAFGYYRYD